MDITPLRPAGPAVTGPLPGARSDVLLRRQDTRESRARTYPRNIPIAIARGYGAWVEDVDGNKFVDFLTGAGTLALGHNHPEVVAAVREQLDLLAHGLDFPTPVKDEFTTAQLAMLPEAMRERTRIHFCGPTGADAVEAALKLCKTYTGRSDVIAFSGSYHGSTHGALSVSGPVAPKEHVANLMPGVQFLPYAHCYRCPLGLTPATCDTNCARYLENVLTDPHGGVRRPAAVILELVQGEGGSIPAPQRFVEEVRRITREQGIPLIVDEIQSGCGRTGTWFAFEQYGIVPDVILSSKALGGIGQPVSVIFYDAALDVWEPGAHIGTFRGNQLAFAAGLAALRVVQRDHVLDNVVAQGRYLLDELGPLARAVGIVGDVRGLGLMIGIEVVDPDTGAASGTLAREVQRHLLADGLLVEVGGRDDSVIRLLPPLTLDRSIATLAVKLLSRALRAVDDDVAPATLAAAAP